MANIVKKQNAPQPKGVLVSEQKADVQTSEVTNNANAGDALASIKPPVDSSQIGTAHNTPNLLIWVVNSVTDARNLLETVINVAKGDFKAFSVTDKKADTEPTQKVEPTNSGKTKSLGDPNYLTIDEATEFLPNHPTKSTLRTMCCRRQIPFCKMGGRLIFKKNELQKFIERSLSHG
jgi:hypothetical protein